MVREIDQLELFASLLDHNEHFVIRIGHHRRLTKGRGPDGHPTLNELGRSLTCPTSSRTMPAATAGGVFVTATFAARKPKSQFCSSPSRPLAAGPSQAQPRSRVRTGAPERREQQEREVARGLQLGTANARRRRPKIRPPAVDGLQRLGKA
jgi:hypothetical protein